MSTKKRATKLKVMHTISRDANGDATIKSVVTKPPKLKEAVDKEQVASETAHQLPKLPKVKGHPPSNKPKREPKGKDKLTELDHKILKALDDLGGKDVSSIDMATKVGTTKTHPDAPRAPIRGAMEAFGKLGYVKSERKGIKYLFSITEKGKHFLTNPPPKEVKDMPAKDKGAKPAPASTASSGSIQPPERPANTDIECPKCHTFNPFHAEFCKSCGAVLRQRIEAVLKAAPTAA